MDKEKDGVWRTIRGRRIFIGKGEDLATAMKNSGKFKNLTRTKLRETRDELSKEDRLYNTSLKYYHKGEKAKDINKKEAYDRKYYRELNKVARKQDEPNVENQAEKNRINEYAHIEGSGQTRVQRNWNKYSEEDRREHRHELIQKKLADYKAKKQSNNKVESKKIRDVFTAQEMADANKMPVREYFKQSGYEMVGDIPKKSYDIADKINKDFEGKDRISRDDFDSYLSGQYDDEDADVRGIMGYDGWETLYESDDRGDEGDLVRDLPKTSKTKKDEKDWLPKATEIKEQGTSNRKQVSDNIQAHILEYYGPDYTGEDISPEDAFVRQMDAMKEPTMWKSGQRIAEGGSYLIYNGDMADFLDSLKINPKGKKFSDDKAFQTYTSLIGRESEKLYNKIKKHQAETINNYKKRKGK